MTCRHLHALEAELIAAGFEETGTERGFVCTECHDAVMGLVSGDAVYG